MCDLEDGGTFATQLHSIYIQLIPCRYVISALGKVGIVSPRIVDLFERLRTYWADLETMMTMELATPTYELIAEKL